MKADTHEISGIGWRLSFQRRVGLGNSANRGALPLWLRCENGRTRAIVPLPDSETVWLAVVCSEHIRVTAETPAGECVPTREVAKSGDDALIALDAIVRNGLPVPFDASTVDRWDREEPDREHLTIAIVLNETETCAIGVTFATPEHYKFMTGTVVSPTNAEGAFNGQLLP